jgi:GNAT superfamily N-acetyltransferase
MFTELPPARAREVAPDLDGPQMELVLAAVEAGNSAARLWAAQGGPALLWDQGNNVLYLAGAASPAGVAGLAALAAGELRAAALAAGRGRFKARGSSPGLHAALPEIFAGVALRPLEERLYRYERAAPPDVPAPAVGEFWLAPIDAALLGAGDIENLAPLLGEIGWMWPDQARFLAAGGGSAGLTARRLICWCTAEYASPGACGIGIETDEPYRRRGVAAATAAHFVAACLAAGRAAHWECGEWNEASWRTAERLGFTLVERASFAVGELRP